MDHYFYTDIFIWKELVRFTRKWVPIQKRIDDMPVSSVFRVCKNELIRYPILGSNPGDFKETVCCKPLDTFFHVPKPVELIY